MRSYGSTETPRNSSIVVNLYGRSFEWLCESKRRGPSQLSLGTWCPAGSLAETARNAYMCLDYYKLCRASPRRQHICNNVRMKLSLVSPSASSARVCPNLHLWPDHVARSRSPLAHSRSIWLILPKRITTVFLHRINMNLEG